jgi:hypothetical protein
MKTWVFISNLAKKGEAFGMGVSLSSDGSIVAVGGPSDDGTHRDMGYVQAFEVQE